MHSSPRDRAFPIKFLINICTQAKLGGEIGGELAELTPAEVIMPAQHPDRVDCDSSLSTAVLLGVVGALLGGAAAQPAPGPDHSAPARRSAG